MTNSPSIRDGAAGAGPGFTSFSNKEEIHSSENVKNTADVVESAVRRLKRMQSGVICAARYLNNDLVEREIPHRAALITLTYAKTEDWSPTHIRTLLAHYRKWFKRNGAEFRYVWVMELQKRGTPHYHIVAWYPHGLKPPLPDKQGWWPHGRTNAIFATSPVGYIAKYASKGVGGILPKGARIWGYGGLDAAGKFAVARALAPRWIKKIVSVSAQLKRVVVEVKEVGNKGREIIAKVKGYLDKLSGFTYLTPWLSDGFTAENGLALRHQGFIEAICPDGDIYKINQPKEVYA